jgi:hypothetical protein
MSARHSKLRRRRLPILTILVMRHGGLRDRHQRQLGGKEKAGQRCSAFDRGVITGTTSLHCKSGQGGHVYQSGE